MKDIQNKDDIKLVVDRFYDKVKNDELLGPVFASRISDWQPHLETMYRFWNAALFNVREYVGNPFMKHARLPVEGPHFQRWINLFYETIDENFAGEIADTAKMRAMIMGNNFYNRIQANKAKG